MDDATTFGSRTQAFANGVTGTSDIATSLGLDAARIKMGTPMGFTPTSVLHQIQQSGNGMSTQDADRRFIGQSMPGPSYNGGSFAQQRQMMDLRAVDKRNLS